MAAAQFFAVKDQELVFDPAAVNKFLEKNDRAGYQRLADVLPILEKCEPWTPATIHGAIECLAAAASRPMGDFAQPLRVAVRGGLVSPPIDQTLAILGKKATLGEGSGDALDQA